MKKLKILGESFSFAISSLRVDKFRTFLSLFGVAIGIFSIVAVFCAVEALQKKIKEGVDSFGGDVIYVDIFPWDFEGDDPSMIWEIFARPLITEDEYIFVKSNSHNAEQVVYLASFETLLKRGRYSFSRGGVASITTGFPDLCHYEIAEGRDFFPTELNASANMAVIGSAVASELFPEGNPVGKEFKVNNNRIKVLGVVKKQGEAVMQVVNFDKSILVPLNFGKGLSKINTGTIILSRKEGIEEDELVEETKLLMRSHRRLKPSQKDNFSINRSTFLNKSFGSLLGVINLVGWVIGGFSLLIGGFGIANIMFVSVKERTNQIGIQKAIGAKRFVILSQFLIESAILSLLGGIVGVLMVYLATLIISNLGTFNVVLSLNNVIRGLVVAVVIGIIAGLIPAYSAAKLDPVKAINA